jgi:hypothetical protein
MLGIRENQKNEVLSDLEWENMGSFISDFAKSNESVTDDIIGEKSHVNQKNQINKINSTRIELTGKTNSLKTNVEKSLSMSDRTANKTIRRAANRKVSISKNPSLAYDSLHSDIRSLLDELQEIKQARIELQSKLNTIRQ